MSMPVSRFPCPSCGADRRSHRNRCGQCGWPKGPRARAERQARNSRRLKFHLRSLFLCVTVACVVFALVGRFGVEGFMERLEAALLVASPLYPLMALYFWWKENDMDNI